MKREDDATVLSTQLRAVRTIQDFNAFIDSCWRLRGRQPLVVRMHWTQRDRLFMDIERCPSFRRVSDGDHTSHGVLRLDGVEIEELPTVQVRMGGATVTLATKPPMEPWAP